MLCVIIDIQMYAIFDRIFFRFYKRDTELQPNNNGGKEGEQIKLNTMQPFNFNLTHFKTTKMHSNKTCIYSISTIIHSTKL